MDFYPQLAIEYLKDNGWRYRAFGTPPKLRDTALQAIEINPRMEWNDFIDRWRCHTDGFIQPDVTLAKGLKKWLLDTHGIVVHLTDEQLTFREPKDKGVKFDKDTIDEVRKRIEQLPEPSRGLYLLASCGLKMEVLEQVTDIDESYNVLILDNYVRLQLSEPEFLIAAPVIKAGTLKEIQSIRRDDLNKTSEQRQGIWKTITTVKDAFDFPYSFMEVLRIWELSLLKQFGPQAYELIAERERIQKSSVTHRWGKAYPHKRISQQTIEEISA